MARQVFLIRLNSGFKNGTYLVYYSTLTFFKWRVIDYVSGTSEQVEYMVAEFNITYLNISGTVASLGTTFVQPIVNESLARLEPTFTEFSQVPIEVAAIEEVMVNVSGSITDFQTAQNDYNARVLEVKANLQDLSCNNASCIPTDDCTAICNIVQNGTKWA